MKKTMAMMMVMATLLIACNAQVGWFSKEDDFKEYLLDEYAKCSAFFFNAREQSLADEEYEMVKLYALSIETVFEAASIVALELEYSRSKAEEVFLEAIMKHNKLIQGAADNKDAVSLYSYLDCGFASVHTMEDFAEIKRKEYLNK